MNLENVKIEIIPESIQFLKMTDEEYFSDKYKDYISNSKLGLINPKEDGSVEKYLSGFDQKYSPSFELGSAVHAKVLQPEYYEISNIQKPNGKLGLFAEKVFELRKKGMSIKDAIEQASIDSDYYKGKLSDTRLKSAIKSSLPFYLQRCKVKENLDNDITTLYLSESIGYKYEKCMLGIASNSSVGQTLNPITLFEPADCYNEYAILAEIKVTIEDKVVVLKLKAKLDNVVINHEDQEIVLNDLKTTGKPVGYFMGNKVKVFDEEGNPKESVWIDGSFQKFHYYRQIGMYLWLLGCYCKTIDLKYKHKANLVVVETIPEFKTKVYPVSAKYIRKGMDEFKELIVEVINGTR